jgi:oxygen-independent coproporphyrinogen III oxidase
MAGIYIHIPFCKQACTYCNFHFSTSLRLKDSLIHAIQKEIELRAQYFENAKIKTIYFGGGTPSLLSADEINQIYKTLSDHHDLEEVVEVTLEANPDDLDREKFIALKSTPINRLSIGIQTFVQDELEFMNRAHSDDEAIMCLELANKYGYSNLNIDLIYGMPDHFSERNWLLNLEQAASFQIKHISCYALTVEDKTALAHQIKSGKIPPLNDQKAARDFEALLQFAITNGYEQYEISNFAREGYQSMHNTSYWQGLPYLGLGPSAHSFDGKSRSWNIANNSRYINAILDVKPEIETEVLTEVDHYNEWIMTGLRTKWGLSKSRLEQFSIPIQVYFYRQVKPAIQSVNIIESEDKWVLSQGAKFFADAVSAALFYVE